MYTDTSAVCRKLIIQVPPYVYPVLILSKRLHSVFVLRCFNDCFATFFLWLAIYLFQHRAWSLGALVYAWGLGIKMSLLLVLPAVGLILFLGRGLSGTLQVGSIMAQLQFLIAIPFLKENKWGYLSRAFELSRQFMFKWTVNWRMLGEELFLSKGFALSLLAGHVGVLFVFIAARWVRPSGKSLFAMIPRLAQFKSPFTPQEEAQVARRVTPEYVMTTMLSANVIGLLFARSLHYQFYSYLAWATPYLIWRALPHPIFGLPIWLIQEWAWNVYPSTDASSTAVVNMLAATVLLVYFGTDKDIEAESDAKKVEAKNK